MQLREDLNITVEEERVAGIIGKMLYKPSEFTMNEFELLIKSEINTEFTKEA